MSQDKPNRDIAQRFFRWLVQADRPVEPRSEEELAADVQRDYPRNYAANLSDGALYWLGASLISATTVMPLFVSKLTPSPLAIGLLAMIGQGAWFLPQLFAANYTERLARRKPMFVNLGFFLERLPLVLLVVAAALALRAPALALILLFVGYSWHGIGAGVVAPAWHDMIARCIPVERRGSFLGITMFIGAGMGVAGAGVTAWVLREVPYPTSFAYLFAGAALSLLVGWSTLLFVREPVPVLHTERVSNRQYLGSIPALLRGDHNFRRFVITRSLMAAAGMGSGFVTVAAISRWQLPDSYAGLYTAAYLLGQTGGNLVFGFVADRFGHKVSMEAGALAGVAGYAIAWLAPGPEWFFGVFVLLGVVTSSVLVSGLLIVMEFCGAERRPTYIGIANTATGVVGVTAPLAGAALASAGYRWIFAACVGLYVLTAALFRWWVRDPRQSAE